MLLQSDVTPAIIMKRVEAASGAKYSAHKETARKFEPIAPVGSSYKPVGKVDIGALRKVPTPGASAGSSVPPPKPSIPSAPRPTPAYAGASGAPASYNAPASGKAPAGAWDDEPSAAAPPPPAAAAPPPPPAASRPPVITSARPVAPVSNLLNIQVLCDLIRHVSLLLPLPLQHLMYPLNQQRTTELHQW